MFSIPLLVLSFGILNTLAQECKDVKMKMSLSKPGRVELDVDQLCRCAGYSKTLTTDAPELSKWKKKPTTDADIVTEIPTEDKSSTLKVIDDITDILTENTTVIATERSPTKKNTDAVTEKRVVIDKKSINVTTEETKDTATEKRDEITYNMTTDSADKVTEKTIVDKGKNSTLVTAKSVTIKESTGKVAKEISTTLKTDKYIVDKTDVITDAIPSDSVTEGSIDMLKVKSVVDRVTDKNSSDVVTEKGSIESDRSFTTKIVTDLVTEKTTVKNIIDRSVTEFHDKSPIDLMTTEKIEKVTSGSISSMTEKVINMITEKSVMVTDKSPMDKFSNRSSLTTDITTEESFVYKSVEKNATDFDIDERWKITERDVDVEAEKSIVDTVIHKSTTEKDIVIIPKALTTEKVDEKTDMTTDRSAIDITTEGAKYMIRGKKSTDKSFISFTSEKDTDMTIEISSIENATDKISTHEVFIKIPIALTTEKVTDKSLDKATTDKTIVKSFIDLTTERSIDKVTGKNVTEKVVDKSIKETDTTFKKMENSTEAALETSHMTKKSGNELQILLILLAIMMMAGLIFAVCYTVYMSHRSNSYVLPSPDNEATPLNNI